MTALCDLGPPPEVPAIFNLTAHTLSSAQTTPDKIALTLVDAPDQDDPTRLSYRDLDTRVRQAAGGLMARGISASDRVVIRIGHSVDFPIMFLALAAIGAVAVPTSTTLSAAELRFIIAQTDARMLIRDAALRIDAPGCAEVEPGAISGAPIAEMAASAADDLAYIIFTSGSSGRPKGVAHAHRAAFARRMMWEGWYGLTPEDTVLHAGAFNWTYTLGTGLMDPWAAGASALIYTGPKDPAIWPALIDRFSATLFAATPGVYRQMLKYAPDLGHLPSLRHGLFAGEAMAEAIWTDWVARTGKPLHGAFGMTECSTFISSSPDVAYRQGCAGRVQPGRKLAILDMAGENRPVALGDIGEIAVHRSDPGLMIGYWEDGGVSTDALRSGWFRTGDLGAMSADGYIRYEGRADDQMNAQGFRVAPEEVENALLKHPAITGAAAVELPIRAGLSLIAAFYTSDLGAQSDAALEAHCADHLANYKVPRMFRHVDDLPRTPNGKLQRKALLRDHGGGSGGVA